MKHIATAGDTAVPGLLALEAIGFEVSVDEVGCFRATRGEESYSADDPVAVLGLVKLVELRGWDWHAADAQVDEVLRRYRLG